MSAESRYERSERRVRKNARHGHQPQRHENAVNPDNAGENTTGEKSGQIFSGRGHNESQSAIRPQTCQSYSNAGHELGEDGGRLMGASQLSIAPQHTREAIGAGGEKSKRNSPIPAGGYRLAAELAEG